MDDFDIILVIYLQPGIFRQGILPDHKIIAIITQNPESSLCSPHDSHVPQKIQQS